MTITIKDVAERAGVSIATVPSVINASSFVSQALADKVTAAVEELGYHPNPLGRALRKGRSFTVALVLPDRSNPFFAQIARGVEEQTRRREYSLIASNIDEYPDRESFCVNSLLKRKVHGLIVAPTFKGRQTLRPSVDGGFP